MSDMGDGYKFLKDQKKERNRLRLEYSIERLKEFDINFESKNGGFHFIIKKGMWVYDFYPSTGKYRIRGRHKVKCGRWKLGVDNLIKDMGVKK
jgi:hypothetical protein